MPENIRHVGGSFAPPLTREMLVSFKAMAANAPSQIGDAMTVLINCVDRHHCCPPSKLKGSPHASGRGLHVPLEEHVEAALEAHIPWPEEMAMYAALFGKLEQGPLCHAAHHLLWYVKELDLGREPITTDKL